MTEEIRACTECRNCIPYVHLKKNRQVFCKAFKIVVSTNNAMMCERFRRPRQDKKGYQRLPGF